MSHPALYFIQFLAWDGLYFINIIIKKQLLVRDIFINGSGLEDAHVFLIFLHASSPNPVHKWDDNIVQKLDYCPREGTGISLGNKPYFYLYAYIFI